MKKINILIFLFVILGTYGNAYSQSNKKADEKVEENIEIKEYTRDNIRVVKFTVDLNAHIEEDLYYLNKILYAYSDVYFVNVNPLTGKGIVFVAKNGSFENISDKIYNSKRSYIFENITYKEYSDALFLKAYLSSCYLSNKENESGLKRLTMRNKEKNDLNFEIAKKIHNK